VATGDVIELRGLRLTGIVGVLPQEQATPQPLELDLDLHLDLAPAGDSDDLTETADYGLLCDVAEKVVTSTSYALLEALAAHVARALLEADARIEEVTVSLRKLRPPVAQPLGTSGVRITRAR
jgi:FolB domain-containing protein